MVHAYNAEEYQEDKFEKANDVLMRTQLFNQRAMALLMPAVGLAMNALSLTIYWVGAAIVNRVSATDLAGRISTFGDIVVFGTYATYIIMSAYDARHDPRSAADGAGLCRPHQRGARCADLPA